MRKKLLATFLAVVLLLGLIPLTSIGGGVAYAASAPPRATAIDATKVDLGENVKVLYAQVIPGTPTLDEGCFYNCGTINIYVDSIPADATELKWSSASVKAALNIDWGSYSYYPDKGGQEFYDVTPKAEDSWKVKNAPCFLGCDEDWDGPVNCYDVAIMLMPPRVTTIDASKINLGSGVQVTYAQVIPGTPTLDEGCFYNCGTINIYVDSIPADATELKWSSASVKAALNIDWGSYSYYPDKGGQEFYDVTPKAEDSWKVKNASCFLGSDVNWDGPVNCYDVAIYEGICPPLATAIDATKVDLGENVKVLYAQVIPGTPTLDEGCFYNCGTINIYVDSIPADATELKWSSASVKAALNIDWGSYSYYPDKGGQEFYDVTPKAEDSWKVKNAPCFLGCDEDWDGPVNCYDVAIYEGGVREQGVVLSDGVASRTSDMTVEITFSASEAGSYVWAWADEGTIPEKPTNMEPVEMAAGVNTFTVDNLTAGAKKLRIWATDASGNNAADPLDISIYAYTSAGWPQLTSFSFGDGSWSVNGITLTNENIELVNYEELVPYTTGDTTKFYAGEVIIRYDGKAAQPGPGQANLTGWTAAAAAPAGFSDLSVSSLSKAPWLALREKDYISVSAKSGGTSYTYCYKVTVSCSEFLYSVPSTWKQGESNSEFTYSPASYQRDYNNWKLASKGVQYTWGTTAGKEALDFTSGSDSFTLTNGAGNTQTYTVASDMPWEFKVLPQKGYDLSALSADTEKLSGYQDLSKAYSTYTKDIRSERTVTMSIKPTGDNKNMVIDTVTLTKSRDKTAISASDITITGNTFTFVMPNDCVEVTGITFKEDTSERYTVSASATKYRDESIYTNTMGTVTVTDGENPIGDAHAGNEVTVTATPVEHAAYNFKFVCWDTEDIKLTDEQKYVPTMTFEMPENEVSLTAVFEKQGVKLSFSASPSSALSSVSLVSMTPGNYMTFFTSHEDTVKPGAAIAVRPTGTSQFVLVGYEVNDQAGNNISYEVGDFDGCQFTVPENATSISVVAKYRAKAFSTITMGSNDAAMGSASATVEGKPVGAAVTEGATVTVTATAKFRYKFTSWSAAYADGSTVDFELTSAEENPNVATFTVPTSGKGIVITANFERDETQNSNLCKLTGVGLYDEETKIGVLSKSGLNYTITLPVDTDTANLANMILKLTISEFATVTKENDPGKNWVEGAPCGMALDTQTKFTVTAEDGTTNVYTITIKKAAAPNAPTLSNGSATRTSKTGATVKFTSSEAGNYFYNVVGHGAAVPTVDTSKNGTSAVKGENTITLSNLTKDARDIYIVVVGAAGGESTALKVEIPAYGSGTDTPDTGAYKISISTPKGGTITTNRTKANEGDEIIVTVTPDSGYQMVEGSLCYGFAKGGAPMDKVITNNRFKMPAGDINITCQWETATTTAKGITSFSINGVAGAVNSSTNTITITMPRGTDVTKLTPVIATNGVKSLTPGNGETVNFTNAVTYTAAMEDGSSKTYTVTVYVDKGTLADQFWDKLTDFATQVPWWQYAEKQQSTSKYPKYW